MNNAFGIEHIEKSGYIASGKSIAGVGRTALGQARKGRMVRLQEKESLGRSARLADTQAKSQGSAGLDTQSRPTVGRRKKAAWDRGWNSVGKSFVPGKGYKAATDLTSLERKIVGAKASGKTLKLKTRSGGEKIVRATPNREQHAPSAKGRKLYSDTPLVRGKLTKVVASRSQTGRRAAVQGFSQPDGRGGGRVVVHDDAQNFKLTHDHEMAHITPRRNPVRFHERTSDPVRNGREEGRADFIAHGGQSTGSYPGNDSFKSGYNEVQGKMASAAFRKKLKKRP